MKKFLLLSAVVMLSLSAAGQGVNFENLTLEQAVAKAKAENKHVFVDVYTAWCGPCKMMDAQVFPLKEVGDYFNSRFVNLKFNAESGEEGPTFANRFGIKAYPTFVVLDGNGEMVHMFAGGILDLTFIDKVAESFDSGKAFGALKKRYDAGERDKKLVSAYIQALQHTHTDDVTKMVDEFYGTLSDPEKICEECLFIFDDYSALGSERELFLTGNRDRFREVAGRERIDEIFKKKYVDYFSRILAGYNPNATTEDIEKAAGKISSLGLSGADILPVYQAASLVKISGTGQDALVETIKNAVPHVTEREMDIMLYFALPSMKSVWNKEQIDQMLALVSTESTKGYIIRSMGR